VPLDQADVYGGMKGKLNIEFYPYSNSGNHGVGAGLNGVQKIADGEPFGSSAPAVESMFDLLDDDDDADLDIDADEDDPFEEDEAPAPKKRAAAKKAPAKKAPAKKAAAKKAPVEDLDEVEDDDDDDLWGDLDDDI
jgi:hypothetical protein